MEELEKREKESEAVTHAKCSLILIRIPQPTFYSEILAKAVQLDRANIGRVAHAPEAGARGERD